MEALQSITNNPLTQSLLNFSGEAFEGLTPFADEKIGTIGTPETPVLPPNLDPRSVDPVEVADFTTLAQGDAPEPEPTPEPVQPVVRPDEVENTEEQQAAEDRIINDILSGKTTISGFGDTVLNNITMPDNATVSPTITGVFQNGATITNNSANYMVINNESEEPIDIILDCGDSTNGNPIYIRGKFNNIYLNGKKIPVSSSQYPEVYGTISVEDNGDKYNEISLTVNFVGDECGVKYFGTTPLSIADGNTSDQGSPTIYAPNATVSMGGQYTDVTATVSDDTLVLKSGFHSNSLKVLKGNVKFYGINEYDFSNSIEVAGTISPMTWSVPDEVSVTSMASSNPGVYNLSDDINFTSTIAFSAVGSGKYRYNLNGHSITTNNSRYLLYMRGANPEVNIFGPGKMANTGAYCIWLSTTGSILNIFGGEFEGVTHVLYSQAGTINIYGGTYKLKDAATADRDVNGNLKFLLNCLDTNYTNGTAKINVYGGKFYEFNPAVSYGEPNGPVSFVAEGYHVVESIEDGLKVYEVVKD